MRKIILTTLLIGLTIATVDAKSVSIVDSAVDSAAASGSQTQHSIKPLSEKYALEFGDQWDLIHQNSNAKFFESNNTMIDGAEFIQAWIKRVDTGKKSQVIHYYQVMCTDKTFNILEKFQSQDDEKYKLVKKVDFYRQVQPFREAGDEQLVFEKLCKESADFMKAWK